jgi:hypothetical protein
MSAYLGPSVGRGIKLRRRSKEEKKVINAGFRTAV